MMLHRRVDDKHGTWQMPQVSFCPFATSSAFLSPENDHCCILVLLPICVNFYLPGPSQSSLAWPRSQCAAHCLQWLLDFSPCKQAPRLSMCRPEMVGIQLSTELLCAGWH